MTRWGVRGSLERVFGGRGEEVGCERQFNPFALSSSDSANA